MDLTTGKIYHDIEWRLSELTALKVLPVQYSINEMHSRIHYKYSITSLYAIWEGFVVSSVRSYIDYVNDLNFSPNEISIKLLTQAIDEKMVLSNPRQNNDKKVKLIDFIDTTFKKDKIKLKKNINTKSNVNYETLNEILCIYNIMEANTMYKDRLDKLVRLRNSIAHGENSYSISKNEFESFITLIIELMDHVMDLIIDSIKNNNIKK